MPDLNFDPATTDTDFLIPDQREMVFMTNQVIELNRTGFATNLEVYSIPEGGGSNTLLTLGVDYTLGDVDQDATSLAKITSEDPFTELLIQDLTIIATYTADYQIVLLYATLLSDSYVSEGEGPEPTPALMATMLQDITFLKSVNNPMTDVSSDLLDPIQVLDVDLTGADEDNHLIDEEHYVSTAIGKVIIRTSNGQFYDHDFVIKDATDAILVEGVDYIKVGVDIGRTRATHHTSSVYYCALITASITGTVRVSYRAYGGEFTAADGLAMKDALTSVIRYLTQSQFLTSDSLNDASILTDMVDRLGVVEGRVNYIWLSILGNVFANFTIDATVIGTGYHWIPIAKLYQNRDSELVDKDTSTFRVFGITNIDVDMTFSVQFDKDKTLKPFNTRVLHGTNPVVITPGEDYSGVENQIIPKIRVIYGSGDSGIQLQIGLPVLAGDIGEILVENRGTSESSWGLLDSETYIHGDHDNNVLLPDESSVWIDGVDIAHTRVLGYTDGVIVFAGAVELVEEDEVAYGPLQAGDVPASDVCGMEVAVYDRYMATLIYAHVKFKTITSGYDTIVDVVVEGCVMFAMQDLCAVQVAIDGGSADDDPTMLTVTPYIGSYSLGDDLDDSHLHRYQLNHVKLFYMGDN